MRLRQTTIEYAPIAKYDGTITSLQEISGILPRGSYVEVTSEGVCIKSLSDTMSAPVTEDEWVAVIHNTVLVTPYLDEFEGWELVES